MRLLLLLSLLFSALWSTQLDNRLQSIINNEPYQLSEHKNEQDIIRQLYGMNQNRPLWIGHAHNLNALREALQNPYFNYKYKDFHQSQIEQYTYLLHDQMNLDESSNELATLDIVLTRAYLALTNFIVQSDIDWDMVQDKIATLKETKDITANWEMVRKSSPSPSELFRAISSQNIHGFLQSLTPLPELHQELIDSLMFYQSIRSLPRIKYGKDLKLGDKYLYIEDIKKRLIITGDLQNKNNTNDIFDKELAQALYSYKDRFKLEQNGIVDKITVYYLNKPMHLHAQSIITNLDKLKVFPNKFPEEYIRVNLPDFTMDYYRNNNSILHMNAVVGRDVRPTPIFSSYMTYLELNPNWNIPENLVRKDLIPALIENPNYLKEHNIHAFNGWQENDEIKNFTIDKLLPYQDPEKGGIPYRFVQYPGDDNALGRIKFMFPNKYSVYLHDTDNKSLFARRYRVYSSGCMRLEQPFELLEVLKSRLKSSDISQINKYRNTLTNKVINFTEKLPVHTTYFTVFKRNGLTHFRKDVYEYDSFIESSQRGSYNRNNQTAQY
ncbi:L,D-transpeptidase family protein [bacterium]|nr:L,D-transpeptidase family protein [bacterium]MBU1959122.1 L,D-transpeptidase family protein [bacterium]